MKKYSRKRLRAGLWLVSGVLTAILAPRPSAHTRSTDVTWVKDIEPIIQTKCAGCHTTGGSARTTLETYRDVQIHAREIREEILEGRMPPWPAARGFAEFSNDRSLTPLEIELLTAWADGNAPLGKTEAGAVTAPPPPPIGLLETFSIPNGHPVQAVERFEIRTNTASMTWISGWAFRPGSQPEVERAVVSIIDSDPIGAWTPGDGIIRFPAGVAQRMPARAKIAVEIHYRKSYSAVMPPSTLELYGGSSPASPLQHQVLRCGLNNGLPALRVLALAPSAAAAGESVEVIGRRPDGSVVPLVVIPHFEPANQLTYRLRRPVLLPAQSSIEVRSSASGCGAALDYINRLPARGPAPKR